VEATLPLRGGGSIRCRRGAGASPRRSPRGDRERAASRPRGAGMLNVLGAPIRRQQSCSPPGPPDPVRLAPVAVLVRGLGSRELREPTLATYAVVLDSSGTTRRTTIAIVVFVRCSSCSTSMAGPEIRLPSIRLRALCLALAVLAIPFSTTSRRWRLGADCFCCRPVRGRCIVRMAARLLSGPQAHRRARRVLVIGQRSPAGFSRNPERYRAEFDIVGLSTTIRQGDLT